LEFRVNDVHVHSSGKERVEDVEKALDSSGVEKIALISYHPYLLRDIGLLLVLMSLRSSVKRLSDLQKALRGRVYGLAFVDPRMVDDVKELVKLVEWVLTDLELVGVKMIPAGWYPYEEKLYPLYEKLEELNAPILFHCGISWGFPDSSRFCRPVFWEALMKFKKLKFILAHLCWPWIDEALAVGGRFLYPAKSGFLSYKPQILFDISSGAPWLWKIDALRKAIAYLGSEMLIFGSDCGSVDNAKCFEEAIRRDYIILKQILARPDNELRIIFRDNFDRFIGKK